MLLIQTGEKDHSRVRRRPSQPAPGRKGKKLVRSGCSQGATN